MLIESPSGHRCAGRDCGAFGIEHFGAAVRARSEQLSGDDAVQLAQFGAGVRSQVRPDPRFGIREVTRPGLPVVGLVLFLVLTAFHRSFGDLVQDVRDGHVSGLAEDWFLHVNDIFTKLLEPSLTLLEHALPPFSREVPPEDRLKLRARWIGRRADRCALVVVGATVAAGTDGSPMFGLAQLVPPTGRAKSAVGRVVASECRSSASRASVADAASTLGPDGDHV